LNEQRLKPTDLKQYLVAHGFQVFRTMGSRVVLADRVRDNLIMDSGVAADCANPNSVRVVLRARASDHPGESDEQLFARVRTLAHAQLGIAYTESECAVVPIEQPEEPSRHLDTWYEVTYARRVDDLEDLATLLRFALGVNKIA
jgi:hypothetical protein